MNIIVKNPGDIRIELKQEERDRDREFCVMNLGKIYKTQREAAASENCDENGICKVLSGQLNSTGGKTFVLLEDKE